MNEAIFMGTYPGLTKAMLDYRVKIHHSGCPAKMKSHVAV
jgi:hypothetical protein